MISIRKATKEDAPAAWRVRYEAIEKLCAAHYPADKLEKFNVAAMPVDFPEIIEGGFYVAILDGEIVGTGMIDIESGWVDAIFVSPGMTKKGVGRMVISHLETIARKAGLETLVLDSTLNAAEFYRRCGFSGDTLSIFHSRRGVSLDCIPMKKRLRRLSPELRAMTLEDLPEVSALGIRSKASWDYSPEEMEIFSEELALGEDEFLSLSNAQVAVSEGEITGYVTLRSHPDGILELEHLFVAPEWFRKGIGTALLEAALRSARIAGVETVTIISDPNAAEFYLRKGATVVGGHVSSIAGRTIPILSMPTACR